jgi:hypothetical protein
VEAVCERYQLPSPAESYTFLRQPVPFREGNSASGSVFLVRSKPMRRSAGHSGRWGLMLGGTVAGYDGPGTSNQVLRVWIKENELPRGIRSQLEAATAGPGTLQPRP